MFQARVLFQNVNVNFVKELIISVSTFSYSVLQVLFRILLYSQPKNAKNSFMVYRNDAAHAEVLPCQ